MGINHREDGEVRDNLIRLENVAKAGDRHVHTK